MARTIRVVITKKVVPHLLAPLREKNFEIYLNNVEYPQRGKLHIEIKHLKS